MVDHFCGLQSVNATPEARFYGVRGAVMLSSVFGGTGVQAGGNSFKLGSVILLQMQLVLNL